MCNHCQGNGVAIDRHGDSITCPECAGTGIEYTDEYMDQEADKLSYARADQLDLFAEQVLRIL